MCVCVCVCARAFLLMQPASLAKLSYSSSITWDPEFVVSVVGYCVRVLNQAGADRVRFFFSPPSAQFLVLSHTEGTQIEREPSHSISMPFVHAASYEAVRILHTLTKIHPRQVT